ncbi:MAG: ABC transporter permease, partial [Erysipelotrichaceae bacterium]|nr:ABC transporter permease [Erysipelotrichaceae bacterium]
MKKALLTDTVRAIKKSLGRYVSLIAITCLGVGFLVGVCGSSPIMATSMDQYNDENNLMDFTIYSSYGFDEDDVKAVEALEGIEVVEGAYFVDVAGFIEENQKIVRIHGYHENQQLNQILLV